MMQARTIPPLRHHLSRRCFEPRVQKRGSDAGGKIYSVCSIASRRHRPSASHCRVIKIAKFLSDAAARVVIQRTSSFLCGIRFKAFDNIHNYVFAHKSGTHKSSTEAMNGMCVGCCKRESDEVKGCRPRAINYRHKSRGNCDLKKSVIAEKVCLV
ncbi:hypothetical protein L596_005806 [Steinernema carpocapsae]|uniref:Uncharacterized protein n=1 Tax=Steinernema carpocapsae TaxID=34508 RepID=A0A4U8V0A9_STECR|nr:hypothetical protein L596_005806 [Steinernema carpocapsae]